MLLEREKGVGPVRRSEASKDVRSLMCVLSHVGRDELVSDARGTVRDGSYENGISWRTGLEDLIHTMVCECRDAWLPSEVAATWAYALSMRWTRQQLSMLCQVRDGGLGL